MKLKYFLLTVLFVASTLICRGVTFHDETLHYKVMFKWGLLQKQVGRATLTLRSSGEVYRAALYARSEPWADKIYTLRDTLLSTIRRADMTPIKYERIAHEDGTFAHDIVDYVRTYNKFTAECTRHRRKKITDPVKTTTTMLEAEGMTVDLLSVFYYIRTIDFSRMKQGDSVTLNVFSGKRKELLRITYHGSELVKIGKRSYETYHMGFTFTSDGRKKSSESISTWILKDPTRIPVKLEGHLKVGKIRCLYVE